VLFASAIRRVDVGLDAVVEFGFYGIRGHCWSPFPTHCVCVLAPLLMSAIGSERLIAYSGCERKKKMKDVVVGICLQVTAARGLSSKFHCNGAI
jgi:hypothetical protein